MGEQVPPVVPMPENEEGAVAVIGLSCRLPGAPDPAAFWRLLRDGVDAVGPPPAGRRDAVTPAAPGPPGSDGAVRGGFLDRVDGFDAAFFGISPREAAAMDPQQRLMLELGWEALEDARIVPAGLRGTATGVFIGVIADDYAAVVHRGGAVDRHAMTGLNRGVIANRISYTLGARGPSLTVDSGQSSSLVGVHLACESLRRGESSVAIAGGVNLILSTEATQRARHFGGLSPDGRCFTFDARANGYVRGEGGGAVVLKALSRALADGDRIHAVIRGSAVNNDGATEGLTVPGQAAQEEVLRRACAQAGVAAGDVDYVELHGTGTGAGDPVEAAALGAVAGAGRSAGTRLRVGSVKTNIGHLEGAAGIAGLLKTVLALAHRELPPSLNFATPHPRIPLERLGLRVQQAAEPWPRSEGTPLAGVSSFGMGGTNAHVVLSAPPGATVPASTAIEAGDACGGAGALHAWPLSGRSPVALRAQAGRLAGFAAENPGLDPADVGFSLATTRTAFEHRAVVLGSGRRQLLDGLAVLRDGEPATRVLTGDATDAGTPVLVFPGQGAQWAGMAVELLDTSPVFAARMAECADALAPHTDWPLLETVRGGKGAAALERVDVIQPVLWAVMVSLAEVWRSLGVVPAAVVGHSQGEIAAACVAGALSLEDAAKVAALRSRAITALAGTGAMASIGLPADCVSALVADSGGLLHVAAVNGPAATVVAGDPAALDAFVARMSGEGAHARRIDVDYASHTPHMEVLRDELLDVLGDIAPRTPHTPIHSTVTGGPLGTTPMDAAYWQRNLGSTVRFAQAARTLIADGHRLFIEASPHPVLTGALLDTLDDAGAEGAAVGTLRRDEGGWDRILAAAAEAHVHGAGIDWPAVHAATGTSRHRPHAIDLPTYPFQRRRHWARPGEGPQAAPGALAAGHEGPDAASA
ncbi:type I polyketide synthase, partial [Nocardiopsis sediminis]